MAHGAVDQPAGCQGPPTHRASAASEHIATSSCGYSWTLDLSPLVCENRFTPWVYSSGQGTHHTVPHDSPVSRVRADTGRLRSAPNTPPLTGVPLPNPSARAVIYVCTSQYTGSVRFGVQYSASSPRPPLPDRVLL
jgi:hypothetical protein